MIGKARKPCVGILLMAVVLAWATRPVGADQTPLPAVASPGAAVALPTTAGAWRVTLTVEGGRIARLARYVVASDGFAVATPAGVYGGLTPTTPVTLDVRALATIASAVGGSRDARWRVPKESTCCDRVVTVVTLDRRLAKGRVSTHETRTVQSGTPLPADAATLVAAIRDAFASSATPSPGPSV